jgi:uncharacterized protein
MNVMVERSDMAGSPQDGTLVNSVVAFCRLLRERGVKIHADASQTATRALAEIDVTNQQDFRNALMVSILQRPEDRPLFIYYFNAFWSVAPSRSRQPIENAVGLFGRPVDTKESLIRTNEENQPGQVQGSLRQVSRSVVELEADSSAMNSTDAAVRGMHISAIDESTDKQIAELERLARHLGPVLATRHSRRRVADRRGNFPDPHRILRSSLRYGGVPVEFQRASRRMSRTRLIVFCDVSRSMDEYASLFLQFSAAVLRRPWKVEVFLFATDLKRVTRSWLHRSWTEMRKMVPDCGGGTRIGACLTQFIHDYGDALLGTHSLVVILSDGLETGDPVQLAAAMEQLRRRSHAVVWLNPLLHLDGYEPRAAGIAAALKFVDLFAPAHDVASLWELLRRLRLLAGRGRGSLMHQLGRLDPTIREEIGR